MPQMQLPVFSDGVNPITNDVGYQRKENTVVYYCGTMPVFSHAVDDLARIFHRPSGSSAENWIDRLDFAARR